MNWAMKDPAFKMQLFRFIDVFPMLNTPEMVHDYLVDYLSQPNVTLPPGMDLGLKAGGLAKGLFAKTIAGRITAMAGNFIAGADAADALPTLEKLWKNGVGFSVDLLGEACVSHAEARAYQERYLDLVQNLPGTVAKWPANPQLEIRPYRPCSPDQCLDQNQLPIGPCRRHRFQRLARGIERRIKADPGSSGAEQRAGELRHGANALKDLTLSLFEQCCEAIDFPAGLAMQSYLRSAEEDAKRIIAWAQRTGRQITVRLIKGAYWDYEVINAEKMVWPVPVWTAKHETDACFERMAEQFVDAMPRAPVKAA